MLFLHYGSRWSCCTSAKGVYTFRSDSGIVLMKMKKTVINDVVKMGMDQEKDLARRLPQLSEKKSHKLSPPEDGHEN